MDASNITLDTERLRRGLFVTALDRPWEGTDFLFQGFLVETDEELDKLRDCCSWVVVDLSRSLADAAQGLRAPTLAAPLVPKPRARAPRGPDRIEFVGSIVKPGPLATLNARSRQARMRRAQLLHDRTQQTYTELPFAERPPEIASWEGLVRYADENRSLRMDLPRAAGAAKSALQALAKLEREILTKGELQLIAIESAASDLTECIVENPNALQWLLFARKRLASTYTHNLTVAVYLLSLGRHLGYPPQRLQQFATIGMLLDIGKLFVDRALLTKTGPLEAEEVRAVQRHVQLGLEALTPDGDLQQNIVDGIAQHHERVDGSGYPKGLNSDTIGMEGKLAAIVDSFAAMTSPRTYAPVMTAYQAMRELYRQTGSHFQESLVDKFVQAVGMFPVGSVVQLSGGEIAAVVRHNRHRRLEPCVLVLTDKDRQVLDSPFEMDLLTQGQLSVEQKRSRIARALAPGEFDIDLSSFYLG